MSKELVVDGKKYLPNTVLAGHFSYTSDYLSKLAREAKVDATRVGRQWYIQEASLREFIAAANAKKQHRSESLRVVRKLERAQHEQGAILSPANTPSASETAVVDTSQASKHPALGLGATLAALTQAVVIVVCGLLVGTLGFVAHQEGLGGQAIVATSGDMIEGVIATVLPPRMAWPVGNEQVAFLDLTGFWAWLFDVQIVVHEEHIGSQPVPETDTHLAQAPELTQVNTQSAMLMLDGQTSSTTAQEIKRSFSDEVEVTFDGPDTGTLQPVFTQQTDESYRFLLVPITPVLHE